MQQPACLHPSVILFLCFSASHPPGRRNVETECFKNSILSCDRRCPGGSAALWCEKQECEDGCRPRRAAGPIHAHHQGPQNRRPGVQERVRLFFRLSRKCACRPLPHTHTHGATRAACLGRESASQASWQLVLHELSGARESAVNERVSMVTVPASLRGEKTIKGCLRLRRKRWKGFPLCPLHTTPLLLEVHTQAS